MPTASKRPKLTITIDDQVLSQAIRQTAADHNRSPREIVLEALRDWLQKQEDDEDLAAYREAKDDPTLPWEQVQADIRAAEGRESAT